MPQARAYCSLPVTQLTSSTTGVALVPPFTECCINELHHSFPTTSVSSASAALVHPFFEYGICCLDCSSPDTHLPSSSGSAALAHLLLVCYVHGISIPLSCTLGSSSSAGANFAPPFSEYSVRCLMVLSLVTPLSSPTADVALAPPSSEYCRHDIFVALYFGLCC